MSPSDPTQVDPRADPAQTQPAFLPPPPPGYGGAPPPGYRGAPTQASGGPPPSPSAQEPAPGDLLVEVECPHCARLSRVPASFIGQSGNCPGCLALIRVPHPGGEVEPGQVPAAPPAPGHLPRRARWVSSAELARAEASGFAARTKPCLTCGEQIRFLARRCDFCGEFQSEGERRAQRQTGSVLPIASVGKRLEAAGINLALFAVPAALIVPLMLVLENAGRSGRVSPALAGLAGALWLGALLLYFGVQWVLIARSGQNLGKRWVGIKIVKTDGSDVGFVDGVILREWIMLGLLVLCSSVHLLLLLASALMLLSPQRRTLHDLLAGTVVIDAKA